MWIWVLFFPSTFVFIFCLGEGKMWCMYTNITDWCSSQVVSMLVGIFLIWFWKSVGFLCLDIIVLALYPMYFFPLVTFKQAGWGMLSIFLILLPSLFFSTGPECPGQKSEQLSSSQLLSRYVNYSKQRYLCVLFSTGHVIIFSVWICASPLFPTVSLQAVSTKTEKGRKPKEELFAVNMVSQKLQNCAKMFH